MQYDIAYLRGHGNGDVGAAGNNRTEFDICQDRVNRVVKYLRQGGMSVYTNTSSQNNFQTNLLSGISLKYKFAITDHMNSANANASGIEIWIPNGESHYELETKILEQLKTILPSRGVRRKDYNTGVWCYAQDGKYSTDYYKEIRQSWNIGISHDIFEMGFISNFYDVKAIEENKDKIALTIANCILEYFGFSKVSNTPPSSNATTYRVQVGAFSNKTNAEKLKAELVSKGYTAIIKQDNYYRVQVGAFSNKTNAEKLKAELVSKGYAAIIK